MSVSPLADRGERRATPSGHSEEQALARALRLCAVSVDLDEIRQYRAIHGLGGSVESAEHAVYERALPRFLDFARALGLPLTLFVVGADAERPRNAELLRAAATRGHELGNHSYDHPYDLSRRSPAEISAQIERANAALTEHVGVRASGFRAPGYVVTDVVYAALQAAGMAYSSSVFPCPYYYAAKAALIGAKRAAGRVSSSIVGGPGVLLAPLGPYRVGEPYYRSGSGVLELPIQVTPRLRLPFIGTSLTGLGPRLARWLARAVVGQELVNLELHGIDLLDAEDGLAGLTRHQPDVRLPLGHKWSVLSGVVLELRRAGYEFVRLDEAARQVERALPGAQRR